MITFFSGGDSVLIMICGLSSSSLSSTSSVLHLSSVLHEHLSIH
jgi:hypothetical protein